MYKGRVGKFLTWEKKGVKEGKESHHGKNCRRRWEKGKINKRKRTMHETSKRENVGK